MTQLSTRKPVIGRHALLGLIMALVVAGCQAPPPPTPDAETPIASAARVRLRPSERRIDLIAGRKVLVPVRLEPPITPIGAVDPGVTIDGDEAIDAELLWISRSPAKPALRIDPLAGWLPAPPAWSSRSIEQLVVGEAPPGDGFWALLIDLPPTAHNRDLFIAGRSAPVQWLNPNLPSRSAAPMLFREQSPALSRTLANAARDPLNRWRTRLLGDRLRAPRQTVIDEHGTRFSDPAIETMAQQAEWRWRLALDRVSRADPFLGAELLDRLTAIVRFGADVEAPAWPTDDAGLSALRTELLDADVSDETIIARVRDALLQSPETTAWIIDDAGWAPPTTGRTVTLIGVAERAGKAGLVHARAGSDHAGPSTPLGPFGVARTTVQTPRAPTEQSLGTLSPILATVSVIGRSETALALLPLGLRVEPPGFRLGPGSSPWTLRSWTAETPQPAPVGLSFYALLHRRANGEARWQLHVECPTPSGQDAGMLRVYLGPSNAPLAILRIDPAGLQQDQHNTPLQRDPVAITRAPDAWIATIDIPPSAIEPGGILRLAIERFNASGERATWPRPVLPWQTAPGRAGLDLSAWNSLSDEDEYDTGVDGGGGGA